MSLLILLIMCFKLGLRLYNSMASAFVCSTVKKSGLVRNNTGGLVLISNGSDSFLSACSFGRSAFSELFSIAC